MWLSVERLFWLCVTLPLAAWIFMDALYHWRSCRANRTTIEFMLVERTLTHEPPNKSIRTVVERLRWAIVFVDFVQFCLFSHPDHIPWAIQPSSSLRTVADVVTLTPTLQQQLLFPLFGVLSCLYLLSYVALVVRFAPQRSLRSRLQHPWVMKFGDLVQLYGARVFLQLLFIPLIRTCFGMLSCWFPCPHDAAQSPTPLLRVLFPALHYACFTAPHLLLASLAALLIVGVTHFALRRAVFNIEPNAIDYEVSLPRFQVLYVFLKVFLSGMHMLMPATYAHVHMLILVVAQLCLLIASFVNQPTLGSSPTVNHARGAAVAGSLWASVCSYVYLFASTPCPNNCHSMRIWRGVASDGTCTDGPKYPVVMFCAGMPLVMYLGFVTSEWCARHIVRARPQNPITSVIKQGNRADAVNAAETLVAIEPKLASMLGGSTHAHHILSPSAIRSLVCAIDHAVPCASHAHPASAHGVLFEGGDVTLTHALLVVARSVPPSRLPYLTNHGVLPVLWRVMASGSLCNPQSAARQPVSSPTPTLLSRVGSALSSRILPPYHDEVGRLICVDVAGRVWATCFLLKDNSPQAQQDGGAPDATALGTCSVAGNMIWPLSRNSLPLEPLCGRDRAEDGAFQAAVVTLAHLMRLNPQVRKVVVEQFPEVMGSVLGRLLCQTHDDCDMLGAVLQRQYKSLKRPFVSHGLLIQSKVKIEDDVVVVHRSELKPNIVDITRLYSLEILSFTCGHPLIQPIFKSDEMCRMLLELLSVSGNASTVVPLSASEKRALGLVSLIVRLLCQSPSPRRTLAARNCVEKVFDAVEALTTSEETTNQRRVMADSNVKQSSLLHFASKVVMAAGAETRAMNVTTQHLLDTSLTCNGATVVSPLSLALEALSAASMSEPLNVRWSHATNLLERLDDGDKRLVLRFVTRCVRVSTTNVAQVSSMVLTKLSKLSFDGASKVQRVEAGRCLAVCLAAEAECIQARRNAEQHVRRSNEAAEIVAAARAGSVVRGRSGAGSSFLGSSRSRSTAFVGKAGASECEPTPAEAKGQQEDPLGREDKAHRLLLGRVRGTKTVQELFRYNLGSFEMTCCLLHCPVIKHDGILRCLQSAAGRTWAACSEMIRLDVHQALVVMMCQCADELRASLPDESALVTDLVERCFEGKDDISQTEAQLESLFGAAMSRLLCATHLLCSLVGHIPHDCEHWPFVLGKLVDMLATPAVRHFATRVLGTALTHKVSGAVVVCSERLRGHLFSTPMHQVPKIERAHKLYLMRLLTQRLLAVSSSSDLGELGEEELVELEPTVALLVRHNIPTQRRRLVSQCVAAAEQTLHTAYLGRSKKRVIKVTSTAARATRVALHGTEADTFLDGLTTLQCQLNAMLVLGSVANHCIMLRKKLKVCYHAAMRHAVAMKHKARVRVAKELWAQYQNQLTQKAAGGRVSSVSRASASPREHGGSVCGEADKPRDVRKFLFPDDIAFPPCCDFETIVREDDVMEFCHDVLWSLSVLCPVVPLVARTVSSLKVEKQDHYFGFGMQSRSTKLFCAEVVHASLPVFRCVLEGVSFGLAGEVEIDDDDEHEALQSSETRPDTGGAVRKGKLPVIERVINDRKQSFSRMLFFALHAYNYDKGRGILLAKCVYSSLRNRKPPALRLDAGATLLSTGDLHGAVTQASSFDDITRALLHVFKYSSNPDIGPPLTSSLPEVLDCLRLLMACAPFVEIAALRRLQGLFYRARADTRGKDEDDNQDNDERRPSQAPVFHSPLRRPAAGSLRKTFSGRLTTMLREHSMSYERMPDQSRSMDNAPLPSLPTLPNTDAPPTSAIGLGIALRRGVMEFMLDFLLADGEQHSAAVKSAVQQVMAGLFAFPEGFDKAVDHIMLRRKKNPYQAKVVSLSALSLTISLILSSAHRTHLKLASSNPSATGAGQTTRHGLCFVVLPDRTCEMQFDVHHEVATTGRPHKLRRHSTAVALRKSSEPPVDRQPAPSPSPGPVVCTCHTFQRLRACKHTLRRIREDSEQMLKANAHRRLVGHLLGLVSASLSMTARFSRSVDGSHLGNLLTKFGLPPPHKFADNKLFATELLLEMVQSLPPPSAVLVEDLVANTAHFDLLVRLVHDTLPDVAYRARLVVAVLLETHVPAQLSGFEEQQRKLATVAVRLLSERSGTAFGGDPKDQTSRHINIATCALVCAVLRGWDGCRHFLTNTGWAEICNRLSLAWQEPSEVQMQCLLMAQVAMARVLENAVLPVGARLQQGLELNEDVVELQQLIATSSFLRSVQRLTEFLSTTPALSAKPRVESTYLAVCLRTLRLAVRLSRDNVGGRSWDCVKESAIQCTSALRIGGVMTWFSDDASRALGDLNVALGLSFGDGIPSFSMVLRSVSSSHGIHAHSKQPKGEQSNGKPPAPKPPRGKRKQKPVARHDDSDSEGEGEGEEGPSLLAVGNARSAGPVMENAATFFTPNSFPQRRETLGDAIQRTASAGGRGRRTRARTAGSWLGRRRELAKSDRLADLL